MGEGAEVIGLHILRVQFQSGFKVLQGALVVAAQGVT